MSNPPNENAQPAMLIKFESISSTNFNVEMNGISAFQFLLLSEYFKILGTNALAQQVAEQNMRRMQELERNKIVTPQDIRQIEKLS